MIPAQQKKLNQAKSFIQYLNDAFVVKVAKPGDSCSFLTYNELLVPSTAWKGEGILTVSSEGAPGLKDFVSALESWWNAVKPQTDQLILSIPVNFSAQASALDKLSFLNLKSNVSLFIQVRLDQGWTIPSTTSETLGEVAKRAIKASLADHSLTSKAFFSVELDYPISCWANDIFDLIPEDQREDVYFYPSEHVIQRHHLHNQHLSEETWFHTVMFFEALSKHQELSLAARLNSKRWVNRLLLPDPKWKQVPVSLPHLIAAYVPSKGEIIKSFVTLLKGKWKETFRSKNVDPIETTPTTVPLQSDPRQWKQVLITGWYGTETNGDKAILGEVLHYIKTQSPQCRIVLTSIYMPVSEQTNHELPELDGVELISIYQRNFSKQVGLADAVVMGGGPMMETSEMINVLRLFEEANRQKKARIVFGCGVGPFHTKHLEDVTARVIQLTTAGFLRDKESWEHAGRICPGHGLRFACDPAVGFVARWRKKRLEKGPVQQDTDRMIALLRANTNEFASSISRKELHERNQSSAGQMAEFLVPFVEKRSLICDFLHMNAPWVGGDDRLFNRYIESAFHQSERVRNERNYLTIDAHLERMISARLSLAMRYHGHIFSMALGIPFVSIDYTGKKGKVSSLVSRVNYSQWSVKWDDLKEDTIGGLLPELLEEHDHWQAHLLGEADKLVDLLHHTYEEVFGVAYNQD